MYLFWLHQRFRASLSHLHWGLVTVKEQCWVVVNAVAFSAFQEVQYLEAKPELNLKVHLRSLAALGCKVEEYSERLRHVWVVPQFDLHSGFQRSPLEPCQEEGEVVVGRACFQLLATVGLLEVQLVEVVVSLSRQAKYP